MINALIAVLAALMLTINWHMNRNVEGTKYFALTHILWAIGLLLYIPRNVWPPAISIILANMLIIIGTLTFIRGVCRYQRTRSLPIWVELSLIILIFCFYYYWTYLDPSLGKRVVMISIFSSLGMVVSFIALAPTIKKSGGVGLFVGFGISVHALFFFTQAIVSLFTPYSGKGLLEGGGGAILMLFEGMFFLFWSTLSFALLTSLRLQRALKAKADRDALTNLLNRRAVFEVCQMKIEKNELQMGCVLVLDLDHFENINIHFGNSVGDMVLRQLSADISNLLPKKAIFGRTGGQEFIILLSNASLDDGKVVADSICEYVRNDAILVDEHEINITVSIGVANGLLESSNDLREIINKADKAMYTAKENGRDRYEVLQLIRVPSSDAALFLTN